MRKVLLFLLLFAAGISVLHWIENPIARTDEPEEARPPDPPSVNAREVEPVPESPDGVAVQVPKPAGEGEAPTRVQMQGRFEVTERVPRGPNEGRRRYHLESKDSRTIGGREVELTDLTAIVYDVETGAEVLRIAAASGRATVRQPSTVDFSGIQFDEKVFLSGVECTLLRNAPIAPLTLRAPELQGGLMTGEFRTDGPVEIEGLGLLASGSGFELKAETGLMRFERDGNAVVELEPGRRATLDCEGELAIRETEPGSGKLKLDARESTVLELSGSEGLRLLADHVSIGGRARGEEATSLGFERIDADGAVELRMDRGEFLADRAAIALTGPSRRFRAELLGEPRGTVRFVPDPAKGAEVPVFEVDFRGAGPLVVERATDLAFDLPGPAELDWRGARLTAARSISGRFGPGRDEADFEARGEVVIVRADGSLETDEFHLHHALDEEGTSRVTASAAGPARMEGDFDEEHSFVLSTGEEIDFALDGEAWRIPSASGVDVVVEGPNGFVASAERVLDFSEEPLVLEAEGSIELDADAVSLRGHRLSMRGTEQFTVSGTADAPARLETAEAEFVAARVELAGELVIADEVERGTFTVEEGSYELSCRRLLVERRESLAPEGVTTTSVRFTARDAVKSKGRIAGDDLGRLACDVLEGELTRHERDAELLWSEASLHARGAVAGELQIAESHFEFDSDELTVDRTDRGAEPLASASAVARGNVRVSSLEEPKFSGTGALLEVDKLGRGTLSAEPGERVRATGLFPGERYPFEMTANWIHFSDVFLEAAQPDVRFEYFQTGAEDDVATARAHADRLEARRPDSIEFSGNFRLEGFDQRKTPWKLVADRARIDGMGVAGRGLLEGVQASGAIEFALGDALHAVGEEFSVRTTQRRIRIAGDPARVEYEGMVFTSTWVEYDLLIHLLRAGKTVIEPDEL